MLELGISFYVLDFAFGLDCEVQTICVEIPCDQCKGTVNSCTA